MQEGIHTKLSEDVYLQFRIKGKWEAIPPNDYSSFWIQPSIYSDSTGEEGAA